MHLKSVKSSENGRLRRENLSYQKNGNSEKGRVGRLRREKCQKNTHSENGRVGRLHREKYQKNGNPEKMRVRFLLFDRVN